MKLLALVLVSSLFLAGCSSPEEETVDVLNEIADTLATIKDKESAQAAAPKLKELGERGKELDKEVKADDVSDEVKKAGIEAAARIQKELMRIMKIPGAGEFMKDLQLR